MTPRSIADIIQARRKDKEIRRELEKTLQNAFDVQKSKINELSIKERLLEAAEAVIESCDRITQTDYEEISLELLAPSDDFRDMVKVSEEFELRGPKSCFEKGLMDSLYYEFDRNERDVSILQTHLQNLVKEQNQVLQEWYFEQILSRFTEHLSVPQSTRPVVNLVRKKNNQAKPVPAEIMLMIYTAADLESCVSLRQVNVDWYATFYNNDGFLEPKVSARNPWMEPGEGDLQSWADCAIVFVGRLQSGKWTSTKSLPGFNAWDTRAQPDMNKTIVAHELKMDQKLPRNFKSITRSSEPPYSKFAGFNTYGRSHFINLWTLKPIEKRFETWDVVCDSKSTKIIRKHNIEITLDPSSKLRKIREVGIGKRSIWVTFGYDGTALFPLENPHHDYGFICDGIHNFFEVNEVLYKYSRLDHSTTYSFADFDLKEMVSCDFSQHYQTLMKEPHYNGLCWIARALKTMWPVFLDLDSPHLMYYRQDRVISWTGRYNPCGPLFEQGSKSCGSLFEQGSKSCDSSHLLVNYYARSIRVVNVHTGVVTKVVCPHGWDKERDELKVRMFPGFLNGKFQTYVMHKNVVERTRRKVRKVAEREPDEEEEWDPFGI